MSSSASKKAAWTVKQIASFILFAIIVLAFWANITPLVNFFMNLIPLAIVVTLVVVMVKIHRARGIKQQQIIAEAARAAKKSKKKNK